jgi:hypothetical protein
MDGIIRCSSLTLEREKYLNSVSEKLTSLSYSREPYFLIKSQDRKVEKMFAGLTVFAIALKYPVSCDSHRRNEEALRVSVTTVTAEMKTSQVQFSCTKILIDESRPCADSEFFPQ